ncbi:hypothetical protein [Algibacter sp. PT7-4]|uniref:hypothetical protein n=1 Tax=Algibacter ulvanivorans TaxID=3400999 RepID=UPI003AAB9696
MLFNKKDVNKINALIAIKDTMPLEEYIEKLKALREDIISDIVVEAEVVDAEKKIIQTVNRIIKPSLN